MDKLRKKIAIVGVGNCGNQVAWLGEKKYGMLFDSIYFNTSEADLAMVPTENPFKYKIGTKAEEESGEDVDGSGKNRLKMKKYLMGDIEQIFSNSDLTECIADKKYVNIVVSTAGGTGSGAGPVLCDYMKRLFPDQNFIVTAVLPDLSASLMELGNTLEFLHELYEVLGEDTVYMLYDNETVSNLPTTVGLSTVNEAIIEDLRVLSGVDNLPTPYNSIDPADFESILTTPGRIIVSRITKGLTEKALEDCKLDELIIKSIKQSCHVETDRNKRVIRWGVITNFTDEVNSLYRPALPALEDFIGVPKERFNHNAINKGKEDFNFLYLIASGLSPINDRVKKITERIDELKEALATDESNKYILAGEGSSYDVLEERKKQDKKARQQQVVNVDSVFGKFM